jgi:hypothetical protein
VRSGLWAVGSGQLAADSKVATCLTRGVSVLENSGSDRSGSWRVGDVLPRRPRSTFYALVGLLLFPRRVR